MKFLHFRSGVWKKISVYEVSVPEWIFVCLNIDLNGNSIEIAVNGEVLPERIQVSFVSKTITDMTFQGNDPISNINLFDNNTDISLINCSSVGNLVSWNVTDWKRVGNNTSPDITVLEREEICGSRAESTLILIPGKMAFTSSVESCSRLGKNGRIPNIVQNIPDMDYYKIAKMYVILYWNYVSLVEHIN